MSGFRTNTQDMITENMDSQCKATVEKSESAKSSMIFNLHAFLFPDPSPILVELIKRILENVCNT